MQHKINNAYQVLNQSSTIRTSIQKYIESEGLKFFDVTRRGFKLGIVPKEILDQDPIIKKILDRTPKSFGGMIFHMDPWTSYVWHFDGNRGCAINMLIKGEGHTYFGEKINDRNYLYEELVYERDQLYLFNTSTEHTIFNKSEERWVLSIGFPLTTTYQDLLSVCKSLDLIG